MKTIYIDQSGKIEDTKKLTIIAYANGKTKALKISAVEKRRLIKIMRILDSPKKAFVLKVFAGLIFLLLKDEKVDEIIIDKEYPRHEATIKVILLQLFVKTKLKKPEINFDLIGKKSPVHKLAIETFRGKMKPDLIVKATEILKLFYE